MSDMMLASSILIFRTESSWLSSLLSKATRRSDLVAAEPRDISSLGGVLAIAGWAGGAGGGGPPSGLCSIDEISSKIVVSETSSGSACIGNPGGAGGAGGAAGPANMS